MEPAATVALSVTTLPEATEVTGAPDEVTASDVVVAVGMALTTTERGVVATMLPDVPVMVAVVVPVATELSAVNVSTLDPVVGLGENEAVTPLGSPEIVIPTLLAKPYLGNTAMEDLADPPGIRFTVLGVSDSVKVNALTPKLKVVVAIVVPDVPVMVTVEFPAVAVLLAVSVSTLVPVVEFGENDAATPLGRPDADKVTLPLKPYFGVMMMVDVTLPLWFREA